jgi:iduronate 2-sulfatase
MVVAPGVKPGSCQSLVEFMDIYPTLADLCRLPIPVTVKGQSLKPLLEDVKKTVRETALTHITRGPKVTGFSLRSDRWRYIEWSDGEIELYDHSVDPEEWKNMAGEKTHAAVLAEQKKLLAARRGNER